jgi:peptidoglycan hydrolase-like protein with peptidoglycan-binding domain
MNLNRLSLIGAASLCAALLSLGCPEKEVAPDPDVKTEEQLAQEAEAARIKEETTALQERASRLGEAAARIAGSVTRDGETVPGALESSIAAVQAKAADVEQLASALTGTSGETWDDAKNRLEAALAELDRAREAAAQAAADWSAREAEALAARADGKSPINPETGLIEGLDGGQYEQYLVSVTEKVQNILRGKGLYAGPADGVFDTPTLEAVGAFQEQESLQRSGVPSPMTRARLFSDDA